MKGLKRVCVHLVIQDGYLTSLIVIKMTNLIPCVASLSSNFGHLGF